MCNKNKGNHDIDPDSQSPLVSVIIPVHNCERYVGCAIQSAINQTHRPIEVIVVDDGSSDGSERIVRQFKNLTSLKQKHKGISAARNLGISAAKGEYIAFLDADDIWQEKKIEKQVLFLLNNPEIGIVICKYRGFFDQQNPPPDWLERKLFEEVRYGHIPSCLLSRTEVFEKAGLFDTEFQTGEDLEWQVRAKDAGQKIGKIDEVLVSKRYHAHNISYLDLRDRKHLLKIFRSSILRKSGVSEVE